MNNVVPMRRRDLELFRSYRETGPRRDFAFPVGVAATYLLPLVVFASYFGLAFLGIFGASTIVAVGMGSTIYLKSTYQVLSCTPSREQQSSYEDQTRKAA
jgi:hypothetical protein